VTSRKAKRRAPGRGNRGHDDDAGPEAGMPQAVNLGPTTAAAIMAVAADKFAEGGQEKKGQGQP
jgi:hypothetical protein